MTAFGNRLLGSFWIVIGILIGLVALIYIALFDRISSAAAELLGAGTPVINFLTSQLGPNYLNWWGLGLALFLVLLGVRMLRLTPAARPVAMAYHLLAGLFILVITAAVFLALNQAGGVIGLAVGDVGNVVLMIGLVVALALLGVGLALGSGAAWNAYTTPNTNPVVGLKKQAEDSAPVQAARLVNLNDNKTYPLKKNAGRITLGRAPGQTIVLDDPSVSDSHAFIEFIGGEYLLGDNESTNGTHVNGRRVSVIQETLRPNDEIQLGRVRLRFEV